MEPINSEPNQRVRAHRTSGLNRISPKEKFMVKRGTFGLMFAVFALIAASACSEKVKESEIDPAGKTPATQSLVTLSPEAIKSAGIEVVPVEPRPASRVMRFTGTVEANEQATQQVTPLVSGRVDQVHITPGDRVAAGELLAIISSSEVAEMHGKLLEAQARQNLAASTLKRTRRLDALGATAGKDLAAAEAEAQTADLEVRHLQESLRAVGAVSESPAHSIAAVEARSPIGGVVTERLVNPGSGVEPGKPLFTIANLSTVWVIANVPESQISMLQAGAVAEVSAAALGDKTARGTVSYIDPNLNEQTRSARVRVSLENPHELLKVGMFCEVAITLAESSTGAALMVDEAALQRLGDKLVVFVEKGEGRFELREVNVGEKIDGHRLLLGGLSPGERIVVNGSFVLKSQLLKSQFAEGE